MTCAYCAATASLNGVRATKAEPGHASPAAPVFADAALRRRVIATFEAKRQAGASSFDGLASAARERLGGLGETDAFARVCLALLQDFDAANDTNTVDDPMCAGRMIEVYLMAIEEVRTTGVYEVSMPFFAATPAGPKHLVRMLTAEVIAELAARDPAQLPARELPQSAEPVAAPAAPKKWYWPFG